MIQDQDLADSMPSDAPHIESRARGATSACAYRKACAQNWKILHVCTHSASDDDNPEPQR
eukprot:scaffold79607_cov26-Tisochrysis_lutea.AAC.4